MWFRNKTNFKKKKEKKEKGEKWAENIILS